MGEERAVNHLPDAAYVYASWWPGTTMAREDARDTLLATEGWIMAGGYQYDVLVTDRGAGVCHIRLERRR